MNELTKEQKEYKTYANDKWRNETGTLVIWGRKEGISDIYTNKWK